MSKLIIGAILLLGVNTFAAEASWTCLKDGKIVKVEGKNADEKKAACLKQSGKWEEVKAEKASDKKTEKKEEKKQESGNTGGW